MIPDPKIDCAGAPVITLAGSEWFVPQLAMRQLRIVVPGIMRVVPLLKTIETDPASIGEADIDAIIRVVHTALTRAYPTLTFDTFLDMPITTAESISALHPIMRQSGFWKPADDTAVGEAPGETTTSSTAPPAPSMT